MKINNIFKYIVVSFCLLLILYLVLIIYYIYNKFTNSKLGFVNNNKKYNNYNYEKVTYYNDYNNSLGNVFKNNNLNFNAYPNVSFNNNNFLNNNKILPECCNYYSYYSTSKGCPCITPEQQYYLKSRGLNKDKSSFIMENEDYKNKYFSPSAVFKKYNDPFLKNNINYKLDPPKLNDNSLNEFYSLINIDK